MRRRKRCYACWALALYILCAPILADESLQPTKMAVHELAAKIAAGKTISETDARAFAGKHDDLDEVMKVLGAARRGQPTLETILNHLSKTLTVTDCGAG